MRVGNVGEDAARHARVTETGIGALEATPSRAVADLRAGPSAMPSVVQIAGERRAAGAKTGLNASASQDQEYPYGRSSAGHDRGEGRAAVFIWPCRRSLSGDRQAAGGGSGGGDPAASRRLPFTVSRRRQPEQAVAGVQERPALASLDEVPSERPAVSGGPTGPADAATRGWSRSRRARSSFRTGADSRRSRREPDRSRFEGRRPARHAEGSPRDLRLLRLASKACS